MDQQQDPPANPVVNSSNFGQHYLAEIKYPNIPDVISIDKIFNVLHKIRTTSKPLFYKWQSIQKPKNGEIFLEQKYPLTKDPNSGEQFAIVDDGYLWSSIPKPEIREFQGQKIEVFRWTEGYLPETPTIPVKTALPNTKISPMYLQQQFFQQLKQQMANLGNNRRSPSPGPAAMRPPMNRPVTGMSQMAAANKGMAAGQRLPGAPGPASSLRPPQQASLEVPSIESSLDLFDSFGHYEAAQYRLQVIKPLLYRLFEQIPTAPITSKSPNLSNGLEEDLIAAIKKKISSLQESSEVALKNHKESIDFYKDNRKRFWNDFSELDNRETDLNELYKKVLAEEFKEMDRDEETIYTSL